MYYYKRTPNNLTNLISEKTEEIKRCVSPKCYFFYLCTNAIKFFKIPSGDFDNNIIEAGFKARGGRVGHRVLEVR